MKLQTFELERFQSLYENRVEFNLTESGIHPFTIEELLSKEEISRLLSTRLTYGQTNGADKLRDAIATLYPDCNRDNVLVTNGSSEANFIFNISQVNPGDEIVIMVPNYMQIYGIAQAIGAKVKEFPLRAENLWKPDLDELRKTVSKKTRVITICNPNNPTGSVLEEDAMREIVEIASQVGAWIYADEVYRGAELDGQECLSFRGMYDKVVVTGGLSKAYALPGLRLGWMVGSEDVIAESWACHDYTSIAAGVLSNQIAELALEPGRRQTILNRNREILRNNLGIIKNWVDSHEGVFNLVDPKAGGMAFIKYERDINSTELIRRLREERSVLVIAGDYFGLDGYIRIGFGTEKDYLKKGLGIISDFMNKLLLR